jgi:3-hydroxyisobutyrate dehydrogenase-like beta-hydroxyacid dehydrogenase
LDSLAWASWARPWRATSWTAGHQLFVYTLGKVPEAISGSSATQCMSARGVAERADIIFIMVPDTPDVEAALFGEAGVAAGLKDIERARWSST